MCYCDDPRSRARERAKAYVRYMTDPQQTLAEFGEDDTESDDTSSEATPEQNAADIRDLVDCVSTLTDAVESRLGDLEEGQTDSIDSDPNTTTERMYQ